LSTVFSPPVCFDQETPRMADLRYVSALVIGNDPG
jgi:hypothetical protein